MRRRVAVDESLPPVVLPGRILNELCAHAIQSLPEECCGLVLGDDHQRFQRIIRCRNEMTQRHQADSKAYPRDGRRAFYMNELDYMNAIEQAEAAGGRVTAVYHSHVDAGAYLSEMDLEYAENPLFPFPHADHIVAGVHDRKVQELGLFQRTGPGQHDGADRCFTGWGVKPVADTAANTTSS